MLSSGGVDVESMWSSEGVEYLESKWSVCGVCGVQVGQSTGGECVGGV